jgi:hypothetical protein
MWTSRSSLRLDLFASGASSIALARKTPAKQNKANANMTNLRNRTLITALSILAIGCANLATATPILEAILYEEDFEGLNTGTVIDAQGWTTSWGTWDTGENADVVSGTDSPFTPTGTKYLQINDTVSGGGDGENSVSPPDVALPTDKRLYFAYDINPINGGRWQLRSGAVWQRWSGNNTTIDGQLGITDNVVLSSSDAWARVELTARMTLAELDAAGGVDMYWDYTVTDSGSGAVTTFTNELAQLVFGNAYTLGGPVPEFLFGASGTGEYYIDNVVVGVVPEPTTAPLLLLAAAGGALLSRRRRR